MGDRGRAEAEGPGPGALPRVRIEGLSEARDDRRQPPGGTGSDQPCGLSRRGPQGWRATGRRARAALDARADAEPSRGERTAGSEETRPALRAVARRGPDVRGRGEGSGRAKRPCRPCRPTPNGRAAERESALRAVRAEACGGRRRQGSLCSFTPVAVDSAFSYENVRQNGGTRRCTSAIRHHLLCLIARRTGVLGRREKGKLFCLGALPAAPAPHFTLFRATVWRQREKVSTSGAGRARGPRCPAGATPASGAQGTWVRGCIAPRPSATLPRRLLRRRVHAAAAAKPQRVRGARIARPGATAGAARRAVLLATSPYPGCLRGSDARERCAKASEAPGKGRPARARAHGERRRERCRARARWGLAVPRAGGPRAPWGGFYA